MPLRLGKGPYRAWHLPSLKCRVELLSWARQGDAESLVFHDAYGAISMVSTMRFHHQYLPDFLQFEPDTFPPALQAKLREMGYQLAPLKQYYGDMQAITWDRVLNLVTPASDPRNIGLSAMVSDVSGGYGLMH